MRPMLLTRKVAHAPTVVTPPVVVKPVELTVRRQVTGQLVSRQRGGSVTPGQPVPGRSYKAEVRVYAVCNDLRVRFNAEWLTAGVTKNLRVALRTSGVTRLVTWGGKDTLTMTGAIDTQWESDTVTFPDRLQTGDLLEVRMFWAQASDGGEHPGSPGQYFDFPILDGDHVMDDGDWPVLDKATKYLHVPMNLGSSLDVSSGNERSLFFAQKYPRVTLIKQLSKLSFLYGFSTSMSEYSVGSNRAFQKM